MAIPNNTRLGRYEIRSLLGAGGMGEVYLADDLNLHRQVAVKVLRADLTTDKDRLQRFEREAYAASCLNHPNILTVHEIGSVNEGDHFIVTEFVDGESLGQRLRRGEALQLDEVLEIGIQTASALAAAHAAGIMHRDIKPDNIMLRRDHLVKILDFGLAKLSEAGRRVVAGASPGALTNSLTLSTPGIVLGTPSHMSPEQARGEPVDARTDIWSLGVVLYEMVAGHAPFGGNTTTDVLVAVLSAHPARLTTYRADVPAELERIITKALRKDVEERYQVVKDLELDLKRLKRQLEFEAELERSGEGRSNGEVKWVVTSPDELQTMETLAAERVQDRLASHLRSASGAATGSHLDTGLTRLKRKLQYDNVSPRRRWIGLAAVLMALAVAGGVYYRWQHQTSRLTEKDIIVLADFANSTGDAVFDDTLATALRVSLHQSPFLNVLSDSDVAKTLQMMTLSPATKLTPEVALELGQRAGAKAYLAGSIASLGSEYVMGLKVVNCLSGDTMAQEQVTAASKEKVLDALGNAASRLRGELGESLATVQRFDVPLAQATTPSFEALQAFSLARKVASGEGGDAAAVPLFQRAIRLDPNFAMAYAALGTSYFNLSETSLATEHNRRAYELRERVSERERFYIEARYHRSVTGDVERARQINELWSQTYPRDRIPVGNLGTCLVSLGQHEKALSVSREALRLGASGLRYAVLVNNYVNLNQLDEARATAEEALAKNFDSPYLRVQFYVLAFLKKDAEGIAQQVEWAAGKRGVEDQMLAQEAQTAAYYGRLRQAREFSRRAVASAERADKKETAGSYESVAAVREALFGKPAEARQHVTAALALSNGRWVQGGAALALAMAGDSARAQTLADDLGKRFPEATTIRFNFLPTIDALLALDRNDPLKAIEVLQSAVPYELGAAEIISFFPVYSRGQAYLAAHRGLEAAAEFQKILEHRGLMGNAPIAALAHLQIGRAYAMQGDPEKARAAYQDFLTLWKDADADIPILKEARAEYEKLK